MGGPGSVGPGSALLFRAMIIMMMIAKQIITIRPLGKFFWEGLAYVPNRRVCLGRALAIQIKYAQHRQEFCIDSTTRNDLMMCRLTEIASYPGSPSACIQIIASESIECSLRFSGLFKLSITYSALSVFFAVSKPRLPELSRTQRHTFLLEAAADYFKFKVLNYWAGEL